MKQLGVFQLPLDRMLVHHRVTPSINFAGTHLYTLVERGTVRVKCLAQEHNTMSPARAQTRTVLSGVKLTNREATAPPTSKFINYIKMLQNAPNAQQTLTVGQDTNTAYKNATDQISS